MGICNSPGGRRTGIYYRVSFSHQVTNNSKSVRAHFASDIKLKIKQQYQTTTKTMDQSPVAISGQLLGPSSKYQLGPGTHIHESNIYASILGPIQITHPKKPVGPAKRPTKITPLDPSLLPTISIARDLEPQAPREAVFASQDVENKKIAKKELLPEVDSIVLCRVTRIMPRQAVVSILVLGENVLDGEWQGLIRVQDVRATEKDKVKIFESFRPGDIVKAQVVCSDIPSL